MSSYKTRLNFYLALLLLSAVVSSSVEDVAAQDGYSFDSGRVGYSSDVPVREEDWVEGESDSAEENGSRNTIGQNSETGVIAEVYKPIPRPPQPRELILTKLDRLRIAKAMRSRNELLQQQSELFKLSSGGSSRGEKELTLCTVSTEGYGLPDEVSRINRAAFPGFKQRESRIVKLVNDRGCDLLAIQGVVGKDYKLINDGLLKLKSRLDKATTRRWEVYTGESNHRLLRHALLISDQIAAVGNIKSFSDYKLPKIKGFDLDRFHRGPLLVEFPIVGDGDNRLRRLIIITFHLGKNVSRARQDSTKDMMQMAEGLRVIAQRARESSKEEALVVLLGDTMGAKYSPQNFILSGRLQLSDFEQGGRCKLEQKDKFSCEGEFSQPLLHSALDLDIPTLNVQHGEVDSRKVRFVEKKDVERAENRQWRNWGYTTGAYIFSEDVPALEDASVEGRMMVGIERIKTAPPEAPFIWLQLNW